MQSLATRTSNNRSETAYKARFPNHIAVSLMKRSHLPPASPPLVHRLLSRLRLLQQHNEDCWPLLKHDEAEVTWQPTDPKDMCSSTTACCISPHLRLSLPLSRWSPVTTTRALVSHCLHRPRSARGDAPLHHVNMSPESSPPPSVPIAAAPIPVLAPVPAATSRCLVSGCCESPRIYRYMTASHPRVVSPVVFRSGVSPHLPFASPPLAVLGRPLSRLRSLPRTDGLFVKI
jgi:hypothetical protein